jgi:hypothetical protein
MMSDPACSKQACGIEVIHAITSGQQLAGCCIGRELLLFPSSL